MSYRRILEKDQPVHIISRALVDILKSKEDCYRFIFQFYVANLGKRGFNVRIKDAVKAGHTLLGGEKIPSKFITQDHSPLVELLDFALVVNHYHFYLLPNSEKAVPLLMGRLNNGFAKSYNLIHHRKDAVFGSRYKSIVAKTDAQSAAISRYINIINPLDVFQPGWREEGLNDYEEAFKFLADYEFSSFPDKIGKRNSQILTSQETLEKHSFIGDPDNKKEFEEFTKEFLKERKSYQSLFLE